ncbi:DUF1378 family protein [Escherichia coli]|uniref:DUF1378 family protein n=1 Tax=Escherichia coli TaxID=562 RepID=UPI000BDEFA9A|nr:DUF1378 family protein [Escherichia coli]EER9149275.1 DUF1378 family protein [Escherichia coli]EEW5073267.1 DUF1378 family protein [Escherichia coli]EFF1237664.1 DUF1378 family protein [Escherichia coli]EHB2619108.1 DUF1378 family protein [Escherichia coli]EHV0509523.1 DUF1378 family protein [Escherichia coli]
MSFVHQIMLYFCTAVCTLYLISGGYSVIRNYFQRKIDERAAEKISQKSAQQNNQNMP